MSAVSLSKRAHDRLARVLKLPRIHGQGRYLEVLRREATPGMRWLDLGCGHQIVPQWAASPAEQNAVAGLARCLVGADVDIPSLKRNPFLRHRVIARGEGLPFATGTFDIVSANMVVEHLEHPEVIFSEILRVLAPGGTFVFHTPNRLHPYLLLSGVLPERLKLWLIWFLQRRHAADAFPTYYRVNTLQRVRAVASRTNFEICDLWMGGPIGTLGWMGPLSLLELPFMKLLTLRPFRRFNGTIIATLRKPAGSRQCASVQPPGR